MHSIDQLIKNSPTAIESFSLCVENEHDWPWTEWLAEVTSCLVDWYKQSYATELLLCTFAARNSYTAATETATQQEQHQQTCRQPIGTAARLVSARAAPPCSLPLAFACQKSSPLSFCTISRSPWRPPPSAPHGPWSSHLASQAAIALAVAILWLQLEMELESELKLKLLAELGTGCSVLAVKYIVIHNPAI